MLELPGFEADDILATLAWQTSQLGGECFVVTGDKDCRQLISEQVKVYNIRKNEVYDAESLKADWGIRPEQVVDFQSLVGDSVDNIKGVPLVGPKVAREWLEKFDTLDQLIARAGELPAGKRRQNLIDFKDQALLSRRLVELDRHVPIEVDWRGPARPRRRGSAGRALCRVRLSHAGYEGGHLCRPRGAVIYSVSGDDGAPGRLSRGRYPGKVRRVPGRTEAAAGVLL